jgi:pimeloyl-[acyl-carrier protein] synthase
VLRYESPVRNTVRLATDDLVIGGSAIQRGTRVWVEIGAANRDPAHFDDPERFDIRRQPNPHLAFGDYVHICLGAALARVEAQVALGTLLQRYPMMCIVRPTPDWLPYAAFRGFRSLPVIMRPDNAAR